MYTPGFAIFRKANEDYKVPDTNVTIPKGGTVMIPTIGFHYDEKFWKNPHEFDPDRFSPEEVAKRPSQCYFPFGEGPRNCNYIFYSVPFFLKSILFIMKFTIDLLST